MSNTTLDLWPEDLSDDKEKTPLLILREQASLLGKKTNNIIEGFVSTSNIQTSKPGGFFIHKFSLVVPSLERYTFLLFSVRHDIYMYPLVIELSDDENFLKCEDEKEFIVCLRDVFNSQKTIKIIKSLLAQAKAA